MPSAKFVVASKVKESFRVNKVKSMFDCQFDEIKKEFDVNIPIESKNWHIGLIIGSSGSGKTTIAKEVFKDYMYFTGFDWSARSIIDDFPENYTPAEITESLSKVGFSSPPEWLKPFNVLSNGQRMRAELDRLILENDKPVIYDEFTSVVDRQVAKVSCSAIQRYIKKHNKKFIAVSCHSDIEQWLEPDWSFDVNKNEFNWRSLRRPEIKLDIRKAEKKEWRIFKDYHYLSSNHNNAAIRYIAEINRTPVAWCSVLHFPHPKVKNLKRIHRIVVLPDYQGIGIGTQFLNFIAKLYKAKNFRVSLTTSSVSFIKGLANSRLWVMTRKPSSVSQPKKAYVKGKNNDSVKISMSTSHDRLTCSFEYAG